MPILGYNPPIMQTVDHKAQAKARVLHQYRNAALFLSFIETLFTPANELDTVFNQLALRYAIDSMEGVWLDRLGDIVGVPRVISGLAFSDTQYRLAIKGKIVINQSRGTGDSILDALRYLISPNDLTVAVVLNEIFPNEIALGVGRPLTQDEVKLTQSGLFIPRPAGVKINAVTHWSTTVPASFCFRDTLSPPPALSDGNFGERGGTVQGGFAERVIIT